KNALSLGFTSTPLAPLTESTKSPLKLQRCTKSYSALSPVMGGSASGEANKGSMYDGRQLLPKLLSRFGLMSSIDAPVPSDAMGPGKLVAYSTSSIPFPSASEIATRSPPLLSPPVYC